MRIKIWKSLFALPLLIASCTEQPIYEPTPAGTISVSIGTSPSLSIESATADSRTVLSEDGATIKWATDDKIALWAINSQGAAQFSAQPFHMWHYNTSYGDAKFTGDIAAMPAGTYTYRAAYPVPESHSGTQATYTVPAIQNGAFNSNYDIMTTASVVAPALQAGDNSDIVSFSFAHKMHLLRITIPANNLTEKISKLVLTFPEAITGTMTIDTANPSAAPVVTNGSKILTIKFPQPVDAGTTAYAFIAPVNLSAGQTVSIRAIGETGESFEKSMAGKNFAQGHTTPIKYTVPAMGLRYTILNVNLTNTGEGTLGEKINTFTLTAPAGSKFDNGSNVRTFEVTTIGLYRMILPEFTDTFSGRSITVTYDSENALINRTITLPSIPANATTTIATLSVPYLFEENFSGLTPGFESNTQHKTSDAGAGSAISLANYNLPGWSGCRVGGKANTMLRITSRAEGGLGIMVYYNGRADTPQMSGLKEGKSVNLSLSFNYGGSRYRASKLYSYGNILMTIGSTSQTGNISAQGSSNIIKLDPDLDYVAINQTAIAVDQSDEQNYYQTPRSQTTTISGCTSASRMTFFVSNSQGGILGNGMYTIYIDNIKVSIAQ